LRERKGERKREGEREREHGFVGKREHVFRLRGMERR